MQTMFFTALPNIQYPDRVLLLELTTDNQRSVRDRFAPQLGGAEETLTILVITCK